MSANHTVVCDADTMSELAVLACLQGSLGPEFAQIHLVRPHKYAICIQGFLTRIEVFLSLIFFLCLPLPCDMRFRCCSSSSNMD